MPAVTKPARPERKLPPCGNPQCGASSGIDDSPTFGWGVLDDHGFWEFPCAVCARHYEKDHPGHKAWPFDGMKIAEPKLVIFDAIAWDTRAIAEALSKAKYHHQWDDAGIGSYEYQGSPGFDSRPYLAVEVEGYVRVRFPELPPDLNTEEARAEAQDLPANHVSVKLSFGGCDEKHSGHCTRDCQETTIYASWSLVQSRVIDGRVVAVYQLDETEER